MQVLCSLTTLQQDWLQQQQQQQWHQRLHMPGHHASHGTHDPRLHMGLAASPYPGPDPGLQCELTELASSLAPAVLDHLTRCYDMTQDDLIRLSHAVQVRLAHDAPGHDAPGP